MPIIEALIILITVLSSFWVLSGFAYKPMNAAPQGIQARRRTGTIAHGMRPTRTRTSRSPSRTTNAWRHSSRSAS